MGRKRIRTTHQRGERAPEHIFTDHDWIRAHQEELIEQYGECYMIVYHEQVIATGQTREEVVENAEHNLSPEIEQIDVMIEWVGHRHRISRARSQLLPADQPESGE